MKSTDNKKDYRRLLAILQKGEVRTYHDIAKEHGVSSRSVQRWVAVYIKKGIVGIKIEKPIGSKSRITHSDKENILSALFNDPHIFGYLRNTWSLRSLARCLTDEIDIPVSFKYLQRITKDMEIRCKRPKLELLHGPDYKEEKQRLENYKHVASALKKGVMLVFEDETTTITQKPCIRKSMSFEGEQHKIEHNGSRKKFSAYISML
jgi:transposase